MVAAFALPRLLDKIADRPVMIAGATMLVVGTAAGAMIPTYAVLVVIWFVVGFGYSVAQTPSGRLLRRSAHPEDRPAVFAAQFALSHACWLICYPLAGRFGAAFGLQSTFIIMSLIGLVGVGLALWLWPARDSSDIAHDHPDLPGRAGPGARGPGPGPGRLLVRSPPALDHPHLREHADRGGHRHPMIVDDLHRDWARI